MCKRSLSALLVTSLISGHAYSLDESRLWLPTKYERHYLDLRDSALAAEALDRCVSVVSGTVDLQRSREQALIFRIQCRQENGRTYNEMVDGNTKKTLTTVIEEPKELSPEELEQLRLEEEQRLQEEREAKRLVLFEACRERYLSKTQLFEGLKQLNEGAETQEFDEEKNKAKFYFEFDAVDMDGRPLQYRAVCMAGDEGVQFRVRKRPGVP
jgi:hypothetical protein